MEKITVPEGSLEGDKIVFVPSDETNQIYDKNQFGVIEKKQFILSLIEGAYLLEKEKIKVKKGKKELNLIELSKIGQKSDKRFNIRYPIFRDLRNRGYITKTALKFGADFRVYERGIKPGEDHAKWVVFSVSENETLTWREWSAKNRVANSTKKRLLIAVVDEENDVSYWESRWMRP